MQKKDKPDGKMDKPEDDIDSNDDVEFPDEVKPWRQQLANVLQNMDPYGFERLSQRLLRECGFTQVSVTKKSGDGGIDGTGKLKINGIVSFNVAFQCKRYKGLVSSGDIRDFRILKREYLLQRVLFQKRQKMKLLHQEKSKLI